MTYLDPMRVALSGDVARAQQHVREARAVAYSVIKLNSEGGASVGRRVVHRPDGTTITIVQAGLDVSAQINSPELIPGPDTTLAFVAINGTAPPKVAVVDVDAQQIVKNITGLGAIVAMHAHPKKRGLIFLLNGDNQLIKLTLSPLEAFAIQYDPEVPFEDMMISPNGERLYLRYRAVATPMPSGTLGGVVRADTEPFAHVETYPDNLFGSADYHVAEHPTEPEKLYMVTFNDGDLDGDPWTFVPNDGLHFPEAVEVWDRVVQGPAPIAANLLRTWYLASSSGFRSLIFSEDGSRLYVCSNRDGQFIEPTVAVEFLPAIIAYDTEGGALTRIADFLVQEDIRTTGDIAVSRDGSRIFVMNRDDLNARVVERDENDNFTVLPAFPCRPAEVVALLGQRALLLGPGLGAKPDNRIFFLSRGSKSLWVFQPTATTPSKKITFEEDPFTFTLTRARRMVPRGAT